MSRVIQITVPSEQSESLLVQLEQVEGVLGLRSDQGASRKPPGDVITVTATNRSMHRVMEFLHESGIGDDRRTMITTSEPRSVIAWPKDATLDDLSFATWEEMEVLIEKESNMTVNGLIMMAAAGSITAAGIATGAVHLIIAGMVIAPGFEPLARIALSVASGGRGWSRGLRELAKGYGVLAAAAVVTALILQSVGEEILSGSGTYHPSAPFVTYWSTLTIPAVLVSSVAAAAGAVLIQGDRSLLTAGVMIGLALIPSASIVGIGLIAGEWMLGLQALGRFLVDAVLVITLSYAVFAFERTRTHRRPTML